MFYEIKHYWNWIILLWSQLYNFNGQVKFSCVFWKKMCLEIYENLNEYVTILLILNTCFTTRLTSEILQRTFWLLAYLSNLSVVRCYYLIQNHWAGFSETWHNASLDEGNLSCSNRWSRSFLKGNNETWHKVSLWWKKFKLPLYFTIGNNSKSTLTTLRNFLM